MQYFFLGIVVLIYGLLNFYIGLRGLQSLGAQFQINRIIYWIIVFAFSSIYFIGMLGRRFLPEKLERVFSILGGYWMAAFVYLLSLVVIIDIFRLLDKKFHMFPQSLKSNGWLVAVAVIAVVAVALSAGTFYAITPKVTSYDISIDKKAGDVKQLKCAMISDVHLGEIIGRNRLKEAVKLINGMEPDIVVIAGDLIDGALEPVKRGNMLEELKNINSRLGVYFAMGNHEHFSNSPDEIQSMLEEAGVTVLRDKTIKVEDSFYLTGREDLSGQNPGFKRAKLDDLLVQADKSLPVIVVDHQPSGLDEARKAGVDLQMSGHTHGGQFFPINLITGRMFEEDNGYFRDGSFNLVVSCGFGTWGPAVRLGSRSEVVELNINFEG